MRRFGNAFDGFLSRYNFTDFHELNLDWLILKVIELNETVKNFVNLETIKYADPIQWNITTQYEKNNVVIDPVSGTAYISTQPVPSGVALTNTDYWTEIFSLSEIITNINNNLTTHSDEGTTATFSSAVGDWLLWNGALYVVISSINPGDAYTEGSNIEAKSVEELVAGYITDILSKIGDISSLTTTDKTSVVNAINEIDGDVGDLSSLTTTDKSSVVNAINEIDGDVGDLSSLTTTDKSSVVNALNEVYSMIGSGATWASVRDYGAVGDGVTDDSAAIQACIDANDVAYFPKGNYLSKMLKVHDNSYLLGDNAVLTLPIGLDSGDLIGELEPNYDFQMSANICGDSVDSVTIRGFIIDGNVLGRTDDTVKKADGIFFFNSSNIKIYDVYIKECLAHGFEYYRCNDSLIENCRCDKSGQCRKEYLVGGGDSFIFHANCNNCSAVNCYSYYSWDLGFEMEGRGVGSYSDESIKKCSFINCVVDHSRDHGFMMFNSIGCLISNCIAYYTHYLSSAPWNDGAAFIVLGGHSNVLTNNIARNVTKHFLSITDEGYGSQFYPSNILVDGFLGDTGGGVCIKNTYNSTLSDIKLVTTASRLSNSDIHMENNERVVLNDVVTATAQNQAIYAKNCSVLMINNLVSRNAVYGLYSELSTGIINGITKFSGTRAVGITGGASAYLILNDVSEIQTSSDITTSYGGYSFVHIDNNVHIT